VNYRSVSFLSDDVGKDVAYVAATQRCDLVLLGWHRASLNRHVVRALVHGVFNLAPCDLVVFVDRRGLGIQPQGGPVVLGLNSTKDQMAVTKIGRLIAESLQSIVLQLPLDDALIDASAAVVSVGLPWNEQAEFGQAATHFARKAECPVLIVKPGSSF
jgi:hypothetical protein